MIAITASIASLLLTMFPIVVMLAERRRAHEAELNLSLRARLLAEHSTDVIVLTDGVSEPADFEGIAQNMAQAKQTCSTVAVGDDLGHRGTVVGRGTYVADRRRARSGGASGGAPRSRCRARR